MKPMSKLDKRNIEDILPLTPMQEGMLFNYLKTPASEIYFEQLILDISGRIDNIIFEKAWNFVIETNEMLRAVFRWEKVPNPIQLILKKHPFQPVYYDFSSMDGNEKRPHPEEIKIKDRREAFDLREVPFRVILCKEEEKKYRMIVSHHHILLDGWSCGIILKEFFSAYNHLVSNKSLVKPGKTKFKEFINWYQIQDTGRQEKFWKDYLSGFDTPTELSIKRRKIREFKDTQRHQIRWGKHITGKLKRFVKMRKITLASLLYGAWALLLRQYNSSRDLVFGTTLAGRTAPIPHIEDMAGLFINTLPLRVRPSIQDTLINLIYHLNQEIQNREEYQYTSLLKIKEYSELDPRTQLFDSIVVIENYPLDYGLTQTHGKLIVQLDSVFETTDYDLTVAVFLSHHIEVAFLYKKELFEAVSIVRLADHFSKIVQEIIENPEKKVSWLEIISKEEKKQILYDFNDTDTDYPKDKPLQQLFEEQAEKNPDRPALVGNGQLAVGKRANMQLSYRELNEKSNQLSHVLQSKGTEPDTIITVMLERSIEMIIGILGILKAGGAYLPIDPGYPQERIDFMLADSNAKILVTSPVLLEKFEKLLIVNCQLLIVNEIPPNRRRLNNYQLTINNLQLQQANIAYIIYTSGSTGRPKGVVVGHPSVVNILTAMQKEFPVKPSDAYLFKTSYIFDVSVVELFGWFPGGGRLAILEKGWEKEPLKIIDSIHRTRITHVNFVPSMFNMFVEELDPGNITRLSSLKYIFLAGEVLLPEGVEKIRRLNTRIQVENIYGPTEGTVYSTWYSLGEWTGKGNIPIGKPLPNTRLYILDKNDRLQPVGIPGELCISGAGVARGYLNNPELTAERFYLRRPGGTLLNEPGKDHMPSCHHAAVQLSLNHSLQYPFTPLPHHPIYFTGDLACWLADGNIEFLGRMDHQVKIRGFRVELGEIESCLLSHTKIKETVVTARESNTAGSYLCAYIIAKKELPVEELRDYLSLRLPDYMVPSYFVRLNELPLTASGKINRKALPQPEIKTGDKYIQPGNDVEKKLVELWSQVLGVKEDVIGIDTNFFDLGGHSLKATRLMSLISKVFNVYISPGTFFNVPTIKGLSGILQHAEKKMYSAVEPVEKREYYPLSPSQKRLYILQQMDKDNTSYNMPTVMKLEGTLDKDWFESVFLHLIRRHESFRTSFEIVNEQPVQMVHDDVKFEIEYYQVEAEVKEDTGEGRIEGWKGRRVEEKEVPPGEITNYKLQITNKGESCGRVSNAFGGLSTKSQELKAKSYIHSFIRPFNLSKSPLLRVGLARLPQEEHLILFDMHHIISDGTSQILLVNEFMTLYQGEEPAPLNFQYKDYTRWLTGKLKTGNLEKQQSYWLSWLSGELPVLTLPTDFSRPDVQSYEGNRKEFLLGEQETGALNAMAGREAVTLFMVLLAVTHVLLWKITGQEDIIIGTPIASRRHADLETIIGMFVNTLAMRHFPSGDKSFIGFLTEVKKNTLDAFENQEYPFEELVEKLNVPRDTSRNPIFDVMFAFRDWEMPAIKMPGLTLTPHPFENRTSKFDLNLEAVESHGTLSFSLEYCTRLFKKSTINRLIGYFHRIVLQVTENLGTTLSQIEILSREEKQQLLEMATGPIEVIDRRETIHHWFEQQVEKTPDNIAVVGTHEVHERASFLSALISITYSELNRKANQLARMLLQKGAGPDIIVGIMVDRSIEMIIGILGILKAGGAYLPIDPDYPEERINYMLADSSTKILVTSPVLLEKFEKLLIVNCQLLIVNEIPPNCRRLNNPPKEANSINNYQLTINNLQLRQDNIAYIIYTSGSTGRPKGVMVEHRSIVNILTALQKNYPLEPFDIYLFKTLYIFDVSVTELFGWFPGGGRLAILEKGGEKEPQKIIDLIYRGWITHVNFVPSMFNVFVEELNPGNVTKLSGLKYIFLAGETLLPELVEKIRRLNTHIQLENLYGPTEGTVYSSSYPLSDWNGKGSVSIGKPLQNLGLYIFDKKNHLQPIGAAGELCISGPGVARGYLNQPELTAEKFDHDLWDYQDYRDGCHKSSRSYKSYVLYKTGDLGRWLPSGNIEFLGRMDHQVKIRGFRVELGEIENQLLNHHEIKEAAVTSGCSETSDYLCAFIAAQRDLTVGELREYLARYLPDYMIPSYFVQLKKLPLTPSGKVDRRALPEPEINTSEKYIAPRNNVEKKLTALWSQVLEIEENIIGIDDNFFILGGHSLKATLLTLKIHKALNIKVSLGEFFKALTIRKLAQIIKNKKEEKYTSIKLVERKEYYTLSSAQERLFILQQMNQAGTAYNMWDTLFLEGFFEKEKFAGIIYKLIARHESLRTSFRLLEEGPVQVIHHLVEFAIEYHDIKEVEVNVKAGDTEGTRGLAPLSKALAARRPQPAAALIGSFIRPFDLSKAPLIRVKLLKITESKHILMFDMHHIISDGISLQIFIKEFTALYGGKKLRPLKLQYKDYCQWQKEEQEKEFIKDQQQYWQSRIQGNPPVLDLPSDYLPPAIRDFQGSQIGFILNPEESQKVKQLARKKEVTLYMVILAVTYILLSKLSGQEDIAVGTPVSGRRHADLENIIGMFVNTVVLRNDAAHQKSFAGFLKEVNQRTQEDFENQDYQYEDLVEELAGDRDAVRNAFFDVMLAFRDTAAVHLEIPGLQVGTYPSGNIKRTSKFDITIYAEETRENLQFMFEYRTGLFKSATIERFAGYLKKIALSVAWDPDQEIGSIDILGENEKKQLLVEFNRTSADYPYDKSIYELFAEQVLKTPNSAAAVVRVSGRGPGTSVITYNQLNRSVNYLAHLLQHKGLGPGAIVGIMTERSMEMIIGIYGILKTGAAYLPIDMDYPQDRINYMLLDSGTSLLVTTGNVFKDRKIGRWKGKIVFLSTAFSNSPHERGDPKGRGASSPSTLALTSTGRVSPGNLVYVIYTSGSTGKPKGVVIRTGAFVNLVVWYVQQFQLNAHDRYLLIAPISFDLAQKNLFAPLITGGCLCPGPPGLLDYHELSGFIAHQRLTVINCSPTVFYPFVEFNAANGFRRLKTLRYVFLGGESIQVDKLLPWLNAGTCHCEIVNTYGPTECTDVVSYYPLPRERLNSLGAVPIGRPVNNIKLYVLDKRQKLLPLGVVGELCIGGIGVAPGYLNQPERTSEKFLFGAYRFYRSYRPYRSYILYNTGDLVRWLPAGDIEFLGRIDGQVKIRGLRIELGEIENRLLKHKDVKEAVVNVIKDKTRGNFICAYVIFYSTDTQDSALISSLKEYSAEYLPAYMIPSCFVPLQTFPLTPSGKVDRESLPVPALNKVSQYTAPRDEIEKKMVEIWWEVLFSKDPLNASIGIDDNFFALGGHSLNAIILISRIHKAFNIKLSAADVFKHTDIRRLSQIVKKQVKSCQDIFTPLAAVEDKEYYPLSLPQQRLYILQRMERQSIAYNIPMVFEVRGTFCKEKMENCFKMLIRRHESLRTTFAMIDSGPIQRVHDVIEQEFEVEYYDIKEVKVNSGETRGLAPLLRNFMRPFDLSKAPLLRVGLIKNNNEPRTLMIDIHHLVTDGVSSGIFARDFMRLYQGQALAPINIRYRDFAVWQRRREEQERISKQETYWLNQFKDEAPVLTLSTDFPRPALQRFEGGMVTFDIDETETAALRTLAREEDATLYMVMLAIYYVMLSKLSGQEDIVVGTSVVGRRHADLNSIIGLFFHTMALRGFPASEKTFKDFLGELKLRVMEAFENQDYPFDRLIRTMINQGRLVKDPSRNPLYDVMFALQNFDLPFEDIPEIRDSTLRLEPIEYHNHTSKFDLFIIAYETPGNKSIHIQLEYAAVLFKHETVEKIARYYREIIKQVLENKQIKLKNITISHHLADAHTRARYDDYMNFGF